MMEVKFFFVILNWNLEYQLNHLLNSWVIL
jgi:hypothetical protein